MGFKVLQKIKNSWGIHVYLCASFYKDFLLGYDESYYEFKRCRNTVIFEAQGKSVRISRRKNFFRYQYKMQKPLLDHWPVIFFHSIYFHNIHFVKYHLLHCIFLPFDRDHGKFVTIPTTLYLFVCVCCRCCFNARILTLALD